jgi:hypothetical protein
MARSSYALPESLLRSLPCRKSFRIVEADAQRARAVRSGFQRAEPIRIAAHRSAARAGRGVRIFDEHGGRVEAHGLVVEQAAGESREVMHLQIRRCIGDQRKAGRVRLGKAVHGKRRNALHDVVLRLGPMPLRVMPERRRPSKVLHALHGAAHAHGAAQLLGFGAGETGHRHGHAQQLLLKERHAEGALQHRFERRMRITDLLFPWRGAYRDASFCRRWGRGG